MLSLSQIFKKQEINTSPSFRHFHYLNQIPENEISEMVGSVEDKNFLELAPQIENKNILLLSCRFSFKIREDILNKNPKKLVEVNYTQTTEGIPDMPLDNFFFIHANLKHIPLKPGTFDEVFWPASFLQRDFRPQIPEVASQLTPGQHLTFSVLHPFLEILLTSQNPASGSKSQSSLEGYFQAFKEQGLFLENLNEGVVDRETKSFFVVEGEPKFYDEYRGIPLVLFLRMVKINRT